MMYISRSEMMDKMQTGTVCSIEYCSFDEKKKKGGEKLVMPEAVLLRSDTSGKVYEKGSAASGTKKRRQLVKKNANHSVFFTRNFRMYINGQPTAVIRKVHLRLVERFNGMQVLP